MPSLRLALSSFARSVSSVAVKKSKSPSDQASKKRRSTAPPPTACAEKPPARSPSKASEHARHGKPAPPSPALPPSDEPPPARSSLFCCSSLRLPFSFTRKGSPPRAHTPSPGRPSPRPPRTRQEKFSAPSQPARRSSSRERYLGIRPASSCASDGPTYTLTLTDDPVDERAAELAADHLCDDLVALLFSPFPERLPTLTPYDSRRGLRYWGGPGHLRMRLGVSNASWASLDSAASEDEWSWHALRERSKEAERRRRARELEDMCRGAYL
ncbi:hypothetical protein JCM10207_004229 [Rhodosporidiobolus poonsookiae]